MSDSQSANEKGSVPTTAAESKDQPSTLKETEMSNSQFETETDSGSVPTAAAESKDQPEVKIFGVSVAAHVQVCLTGTVNVYAADVDEAIEKLQAQIDDRTLDDDLEMENLDSGYYIMPYGNLKHSYDVYIQTDGVEVVEVDVDPFEVLATAVEGAEDLQAQFASLTERFAKSKAFLKSLLNQGDDEQAVAT